MNRSETADDNQRFAPLNRRQAAARTSDRVYDQLVAAIRDLRLPPGSTLSETDLADRFKVSRTPVREAIARLADAGLVQVAPQVGTRVSLIRLFDVEEARFVRESLETAAFAAACERAERDVSELRRILDLQRSARDRLDIDRFFEADEALHEAVFTLSGYPGAWQAVQRMKLQLDRLRRLTLPDRDVLDSLIDEHTHIVDALEAGSVSVGLKHLRRHARRVLGHMPEMQRKHPDYFSSERTDDWRWER